MKQKKRIVLIMVACFFSALALLAASPLKAQSRQILVAEIDGPVTPAMASFFERVIEDGQQSGAEAVLIMLDTPGGAVVTAQEIVQIFRSADLPVILYVAPNGAQAASAGSLITAAAHIAAMAPETVIGAASPVDGSGADLGETIYRKAVEDLKALMRTLTERRGPEAVALAESMIEEARAVAAAAATGTIAARAAARARTVVARAVAATGTTAAVRPGTATGAVTVRIGAAVAATGAAATVAACTRAVARTRAFAGSTVAATRTAAGPATLAVAAGAAARGVAAGWIRIHAALARRIRVRAAVAGPVRIRAAVA
jgi:ATP-dependent protease ClpP protease subunit